MTIIITVSYDMMHGVGGTELTIRQMNEAMIAASPEPLTIHLVYPSTESGPCEEVFPNGRVIHRRLPARPFTISLSMPDVRDMYRAIRDIVRQSHGSVRLLQHYSPVVPSGLVAVFLASLRFGLPRVITSCYATPRWKFGDWYTLKRRAVTFVLTIGTYLTGPHRESLRGFGTRPALVGQMVDTAFFAPQPEPVAARFRDRYGLGAAPIILYPARITATKGQRDLVGVAATLRARGLNAHIVLMGPVNEPSYLDDLRRELSAQGVDAWFTILPAGSREDVRAAYAASSVLVFPTYLEAIGMIQIEAGAMERPVVAYATGGVPDAVVDGVTGYLVPTGDTDALTARILELLEHPDRARAMGAAGRRFAVERFDVRMLAARQLELFRKAAIPMLVPSSAGHRS